MLTFYELATTAFDPIHHFWDQPRTKRLVAIVQVFAFLLGLAGIALNRAGWLPPGVAALTPLSYYSAINLAFTLVLIQEVVDLVFTLPCSVSKAVGKQIEILCLIMLRNAFKELSHFPVPLHLTAELEPLLPMLADGAGALLIFIGLGFYYRIHRQRPSGQKRPWLYSFVALKKFLALVLLLVFVGLCASVGLGMHLGEPEVFFEIFYTVLVFSDILLVLLSHCFLPNFISIFRNSGFALVTLLLRLSLASPAFMSPLLGVLAVGLAISISAAYNVFFKERST